MADLPGPKIHISQLAEEPNVLKRDNLFALTTDFIWCVSSSCTGTLRGLESVCTKLAKTKRNFENCYMLSDPLIYGLIANLCIIRIHRIKELVVDVGNAVKYPVPRRNQCAFARSFGLLPGGPQKATKILSR